MSVLNKMRRNLDLFRSFGFGALKRFRRGSPITALSMRGVGPVHLRLADSDLATFDQVFRNREYDLDRIGGSKARANARYRSILAEGRVPVIVDAGANVGAASIWFAKTFPDARIVAIEPDHENADLLRLNTAAFPAVIVVEAAIAGESGNVSLEGNGMSWAITTVRTETGGVPAITMAKAFASVPNSAPFAAKIDIEGFEDDVFAGNVDWIDDTAVLFIEPHDWLFPGRYTSRSFQQAMGARAFELFIIGENLVYVAI